MAVLVEPLLIVRRVLREQFVILHRRLLAIVRDDALGVDDDPRLVIDEIVRIVGKERVHARPDNPGRLRIGQRDLLGGLASTAAAAGSASVAAAILLLIAGGIDCREVLSDRMGCFLRLRPGNRLVTGEALLLVSIGFQLTPPPPSGSTA